MAYLILNTHTINIINLNLNLFYRMNILSKITFIKTQDYNTIVKLFHDSNPSKQILPHFLFGYLILHLANNNGYTYDGYNIGKGIDIQLGCGFDYNICFSWFTYIQYCHIKFNTKTGKKMNQDHTIDISFSIKLLISIDNYNIILDISESNVIVIELILMTSMQALYILTRI